MNRNKRRQLRVAAQHSQEQQTMSNSFETNESQNNQSQAQQAPATKPVGAVKRVLVLRCRQAALDVVLDGVSVIRAQARLMECLDKDDWLEAFRLTKEEIQHQRDELLQNATLEDSLRMAEDTGEDIMSFAERTGTSFDDIATTFENMRGDKVNL